jgi:hypothetical protein
MINWLINNIFHIIPAIIHRHISVIDCVMGWYGCFRMTPWPIWKRTCSNMYVINIFKYDLFNIVLVIISWPTLTCGFVLNVRYGCLRMIIISIWKIRPLLISVYWCYLVISGLILYYFITYQVLYLQNVKAGKKILLQSIKCYCFSSIILINLKKKWIFILHWFYLL